MSGQEEDSGKLFVGGLSWDTNEEKLKNYFKKFGEVTEAIVMRNPETNKPRGFGFVTFKDPDCVTIVLCTGPHELDGRTIDPKACSTKHAKKNRRTNAPKVFLGGLSSNITETDLREFFSKYGKVGHIVIMYDQERNKSKGFGFLAFESEESVARVCAEQYFIVKGKKIEAKRAVPIDQNAPKNNYMPMNNKQGMGPPGGPGGPNQWGPGGWGGPQGPMPMGGGPMPAANGAMPGAPGYQGGWGTPPQGGFPMQGWGPQPGPAGWGGYGPGYGPGFPAWGYGPGWGPYGQGYGYGYNYGMPPMGGGNPVAPTGPMGPGGQPMGPSNNPPNQGGPMNPPSGGPPGPGGPMNPQGGPGPMSNYGPGSNPNPNQNMPNQNMGPGKSEYGGYGSGSGYNAQGYNMPPSQSDGGPMGRGSSGGQNYHPYRR